MPLPITMMVWSRLAGFSCEACSEDRLVQPVAQASKTMSAEAQREEVRCFMIKMVRDVPFP